MTQSRLLWLSSKTWRWVLSVFQLYSFSIVLVILTLLHVHKNFIISLSISTKITYQDVDWSYTESIACKYIAALNPQHINALLVISELLFDKLWRKIKIFILPSFIPSSKYSLFFKQIQASDLHYFSSLKELLFNIFCKADKLAMNSISFCLRVIISPSLLNNFAGHRILGRCVFLLKTFKLFHSTLFLLALFLTKLNVILTSVPLQVIIFPLASFRNFFIFGFWWFKINMPRDSFFWHLSAQCPHASVS